MQRLQTAARCISSFAAVADIGYEYRDGKREPGRSTATYWPVSSGTHCNPAVSIGLALRRELPWSSAALYIVCQVSGAILGCVGSARHARMAIVHDGSREHGTVVCGSGGNLWVTIFGGLARTPTAPGGVQAFIGAQLLGMLTAVVVSRWIGVIASSATPLLRCGSRGKR
jgi:hypothetical protein